MKVIYDHDRIGTPLKVSEIFHLWLQFHNWQRRPRLTTKRFELINSKIQEFGYSECINVFNFLKSNDPYAAHVRETGHTKLKSIFKSRKWEEKIERSRGVS